VTEDEKRFYNLYLKISRSARNKPFKYRKDFSNFESSDKGKVNLVHLKRIATLFRKFSHIDPEKYFKAPFDLYPDTEYFDLSFFSSRKAIKAYTIMMNKAREETPDTDDQIVFIKDSLRYIALFCIKENITLEDYITYKKGATYSWMKHVKQHNISMYSLLEFPETHSIISKTPRDELDLFLPSIADKIGAFKARYRSSQRAQKVVKEGLVRIKKFIENDKKSTKPR
jgi:hypothetical protein